MALRRKLTSATVCAMVLASLAVLAGCGGDKHPDPAREGLTVDVAGVEYTVYITRELNLKIPPDQAYYNGPEAPPGQVYYGVFIQTCNPKGSPKPTADSFTVKDNQGNEFRPTPIEEKNPFAYHPRMLAKGECIPQAGSVAQLGPTEASMLLFKLPLSNTENRPLELEIQAPTVAETRSVELDL
jgi:hypothetical protein